MADLLSRITFDDGLNGGRASIRGLRIRVQDVLEMLAGGSTPEEVLDAFPYLEPDDVRACLAYAAAQSSEAAVIG